MHLAQRRVKYALSRSVDALGQFVMSSFSAAGWDERKKKRVFQTSRPKEYLTNHKNMNLPFLCLISKWHKSQLVEKFLLEAHKTRSSGQKRLSNRIQIKRGSGSLRLLIYNWQMLHRAVLRVQTLACWKCCCWAPFVTSQTLLVLHTFWKKKKKKGLIGVQRHMRLAWNGTLERQLPPSFYFPG